MSKIGVAAITFLIGVAAVAIWFSYRSSGKTDSSETNFKVASSPPNLNMQLEAKTIHFCKLIRNPSHYDGQIVRTRATLFTGTDTAELKSLECDSNSIRVGAECSTGDGCERVHTAITSFLSETSWHEPRTIDVIGRFHADLDVLSHQYRFKMFEVRGATRERLDAFIK